MADDTRKRWTVMRWSGRDGDAPRKVFAGPEEKARVNYAKLEALIDGEGGRGCGIGHRAHGGCHSHCLPLGNSETRLRPRFQQAPTLTLSSSAAEPAETGALRTTAWYRSSRLQTAGSRR